MTRPSTNGPGGALAIAAGVTTWITLWAWHEFIDANSSYLGPLGLGIVLVGGTGVLARWARLPAVVVIACQVLAIMLFANARWGSGLLPTPHSLEVMVRALSDSVDISRNYRAPLPSAVPNAAVLLVVGGLVCHLVVDALASTLRRVPLAGLPLLAVYSLPVSILDRSVSAVVFVLAAVGFLGMLVLQEADRVARWGRPVRGAGDAEPVALSGRTAPRSSFGIGATATAIAVVLPLAIPTLDLAVFDGPGGSGGSGDRQVRISNPITDLRRDLVQGPDKPVVRVHAEERPSYMRIAALTAFAGTTWSPGARDLPADQSAEGEVPPPIGMDPDVPRLNATWNVEVADDFESLWLPTSLYVSRVDAGPDWRYDSSTLDFHTAENDVNTAGLSYELSALDPTYSADELEDAAPVPLSIDARFTKLPGDLPESVSELADEVTSGASTPFEKALTLQRFFRNGQNGFVYDTGRDAGNGNNDLVEFLDEETGRRGYCEQYASAMAVMARSLDIPARVAVGFLNSDEVPGVRNTWEFSTDDLHAWPELYFEGYGWVLFEPTPASRAGRIPDYTRAEGPATGPSAGPTTSASVSGSPGAPTRQPTDRVTSAGVVNGSDDDGSLWRTVLLVGAGMVLLLIVLALLPIVVRRTRTSRRWHRGTPSVEAAWAELRDTAVDLGVGWPDGRSPRATGRWLVKSFAAPTTPDSPVRPVKGAAENPEAARALDRIVRDLEELRYAPEGSAQMVGDELRSAFDLCVEALRAGAGSRARSRAKWLPRSVLGRRTATSGPRQSTVRSNQDMVDHVG